MPREHVYATTVTVDDGDLRVLAARSRAELDPPPSPPDDGLRRRHDAYAAFVDDLAGRLTSHVQGAASVDTLERELGRLLDRLRELPPVAEPTDVVAPDDAVDAAPALRRVQTRVALSWERDAARVYLRVDGYAHGDDGRPPGEVDLGGLTAELDWGAVNRLVRKARVARDQAHGAPE